jgi:glycosyltransferase involved in cell wall biosynthesis
MKGSDAFLYPSRWEGLPFAVVEAMAVGQLCLVTPASDPAGLLAKEGGGVVFPSKIEGIREGLVEGMNLSADKRTSLLQISADIVRDHMTWTVIGRIIEKSYYKVLKSD